MYCFSYIHFKWNLQKYILKLTGNSVNNLCHSNTNAYQVIECNAITNKGSTFTIKSKSQTISEFV